jgi:mitochondrial transcription factor 1
MITKTLSRGSINHTLLILANLTSLKAIQSQSQSSVSSKYLQDYISGMMNQENSLHHYGLVRMVTWVPDDEKHIFLPRTITERKKFSVRLDLTAQVKEVAGADREDTPTTRARRQHDLTIRSEQLVAERSKLSDPWDPPNRRPSPSTPPWYEIGLVPDALEELRRLPHTLPWHDELLDFEDMWAKKNERNPQKASSRRREGAGRPRSKEPESLRFLRAKFLTVRKAKTIAQQWANRQNEIDKVEIACSSGGLMPSTAPTIREDTQQKAHDLHTEMDQGRKDLALLARKYIDDIRGFEQHPSLLQWDRRTVEPLVVQDKEFHQPKKMALLDIRPMPEALEKLNDFDKRTCFDFLLNILFRNPSQPIRNDLTTVVQGGLDDFIGRVPDLTNLSKGGNPNLDDLRARTLPVDLLVQLVLALETWPFRMQTHEMIMNTGRRKANALLDDE